ncbi:tetratricopeptide repeat protein [Streptomyces venezuelae]|uniref:tetratricopeptide repeat protein n=1 Tax=Streptomyces venezuelae TaxID=54571 RepID=UPI003332DF70
MSESTEDRAERAGRERLPGGGHADHGDAPIGSAAELLGRALPDVSHPWVREDPPLSPLVPHTRALLRRTTRRAGTGSTTVARVLDCALRLVVGLHRAGDHATALSLAQDALACGTRLPDPGHPALIAIRQRAGRALYRLGRYEEAEAAHRRALADATAAFGADAVETLESCVGLAPVLFWAVDQKAEAVALSRRAVDGRTAALGPVHPSTLIARAYLLEFTIGPEPDPVTGPELLKDCRETLGPAHQITLIAELTHGFALVAGHDQRRALPLVRGVVSAFEHVLGPDHPRTLAARALLSRTLGELGLHEEAVAQAELVSASRARVLGPEHPWTTWSLERLAERRRAGRTGR